MKGLDYISACAIKNQENIIEYSPYSVDIEIRHISHKEDDTTIDTPFGYSEIVSENKVASKGIIKFKPTRAFLKANGIFYDKDLPIIAYFKPSDNITYNDEISVVTRDLNNTFTDTFQVVDINTKGFSQTANKIYILAPIR